MKNFNFISFLSSILILAGFFSSCQSEADVQLLPVDIVTAGGKVWKFSYYKINGEDKLNECSRDDLFTFNKKDKIYNWDINKVKCDAQEVNQKFPFSFSEDGKKLTISVFEWEVKQLDMNNIKIAIELNSGKQEVGYVPVTK